MDAMTRLYHLLCILVVYRSASFTSGLDNGLALTPPMGWSTWLGFECRINAGLIKRTADIMYSEGYASVGYVYIVIDDCWQSSSRDGNGRLKPDESKFPNGIKDVADYVHSRGLKLGIFTDVGPTTGKLKPGSEGNFQLDATTFAEWGIDYVKVSASSASPYILDRVYTEFGYYLNITRRHMVYATSWPVYQLYKGVGTNYYSVAKTCNTWRVYGDMQNNWATVDSILKYVGIGSVATELNTYSGPGAWNDLDAMAIGNGGLTLDQCKAQLAMWSILASPLFMSADLSKVTPELKRVLLNYRVIAINQDRLGIRGVKLHEDDGIQIWIRPITPVVNGYNYSFALAFLNINTYAPRTYSVSLRGLTLYNSNGYFVTDLLNDFPKYNNHHMTSDGVIDMVINPTGVAFFKIEAAYSQPQISPSY